MRPSKRVPKKVKNSRFLGQIGTKPRGKVGIRARLIWTFL